MKKGAIPVEYLIYGIIAIIVFILFIYFYTSVSGDVTNSNTGLIEGLIKKIGSE